MHTLKNKQTKEKAYVFVPERLISLCSKPAVTAETAWQLVVKEICQEDQCAGELVATVNTDGGQSSETRDTKTASQSGKKKGRKEEKSMEPISSCQKRCSRKLRDATAVLLSSAQNKEAVRQIMQKKRIYSSALRTRSLWQSLEAGFSFEHFVRWERARTKC